MKYQEETKYLKESPTRRMFVKKFLSGLKGLTVALYNHTDHGENTFYDLTGIKLTPKLKKDFDKQKELGVFFISGSTPAKTRKEIRIFLNQKESELGQAGENQNFIVIGQFNVLSTGINIPLLKNLVFLSGTKSYVKVIQAIGRVLRKHKNKNKAYVFDLVDDLTGGTRDTENYSLKHFWYRMTFYQNEQFPIVEKEIKL